jgi:beta-aspartyl-peptidase (threonine type)
VLLAVSACRITAAWAAEQPLAIVIHGGAGVIEPSKMTAAKAASYRSGLAMALDAGYAVLERGGTSLDAVTAAVRIMEDDPQFNAGRGAVLNHEGDAELDAAIMDGTGPRAGAVASVLHVKNPIELARLVMEKSPHVLLVGEGAEEFALEQGVVLVPRSYFRTEARERELEEELRAERTNPAPSSRNERRAPPDDAAGSVGAGPMGAGSVGAGPMGAGSVGAGPVGAGPVGAGNVGAGSMGAVSMGTVGAVALDRFGHLAAATSTGGLTNKHRGRVGDSPIIGAGTYANNESCAVSGTGQGEYFLRQVVAYDICALVQYRHMKLAQAVHEVIQEKLRRTGGEGGVIALDPAGNIGMDFNSVGMFRGARDSRGRREIAMYRDEATSAAAPPR